MKIDIPYNNKMFSISFGFDRNVAIATWYGVVFTNTHTFRHFCEISNFPDYINNSAYSSKKSF